MKPEMHELKSSLRQEVLLRLAGLSVAQRAAGSARACAWLEQHAPWQQARSVLLYAPMPEELDVWPLVVQGLAAGKAVALPRFDPASKQYFAHRIEDLARDIRSGHFGIREPGDHCSAVELGGVDLVLVPGVAFDLRGGRLGRGRGYYDRLLTQVRGATCGVAFVEQIVPEVPMGPRDVRLQFVLTPTRGILPVKR
jgi:5-formyltetrahydrofolate cyclo-ligase